MTIPLATPLFVLLLTTFALLQIPRQTFAAPPQDITSIDHDRNTYLSLETQLWSRIERLDPTEAESLTAIFEMYHNFTANHLPMVLTSVADSDSFIALERIYEWKSVEQHIMGVTNLFEVIRLTLNKWAESPEPKSFERLEMLDLAETILDDSKQSFRVASTMADIENIMLTQNLYRRASLVKWEEGNGEELKCFGSSIRISFLFLFCRNPRIKYARHVNLPSRCCTNCTRRFR